MRPNRLGRGEIAQAAVRCAVCGGHVYRLRHPTHCGHTDFHPNCDDCAHAVADPNTPAASTASASAATATSTATTAAAASTAATG